MRVPSASVEKISSRRLKGRAAAACTTTSTPTHCPRNGFAVADITEDRFHERCVLDNQTTQCPEIVPAVRVRAESGIDLCQGNRNLQ